MSREHLSSRRSKSHRSKHKACKYHGCKRERKSKTRHGETVTYEFCQKHLNMPKSGDWSNKTSSESSSDADSDQRPAFNVPNYARHNDASPPMSGFFSYGCCHQSCNSCSNVSCRRSCCHHEQDAYRDRCSNCSRTSTQCHRSPSPPVSPRQVPVDGDMPPRERPLDPNNMTASDPHTPNESRTSVQTDSTAETAPAPVEPKTEGVTIGQGKQQEWDETEAFPTFFSGVGVGLCILMQIIYVLLRMLLEFARGSKRGMW